MDEKTNFGRVISGPSSAKQATLPFFLAVTSSAKSKGHHNLASVSVKIWKTLLEKSPGDYKEAVVKRMYYAISPSVLAPNILDHRYMGRDLTTSEMNT